jgi:hypothetical protein
MPKEAGVYLPLPRSSFRRTDVPCEKQWPSNGLDLGDLESKTGIPSSLRESKKTIAKNQTY